MINCANCGGPTIPGFSSNYCVKECDLTKIGISLKDCRPPNLEYHKYVWNEKAGSGILYIKQDVPPSNWKFAACADKTASGLNMPGLNLLPDIWDPSFNFASWTSTSASVGKNRYEAVRKGIWSPEIYWIVYII